MVSPYPPFRSAAVCRRELHDLVQGWTGNRPQVVEMSAYQWSDHRRRRTPLFDEISRDAVWIAGDVPPAGSARTGGR
jgi:hypothetical protein